jgi:hypothetical protein
MIDHCSTCMKIHVQYWTLTFISKTNLGQNPLSVSGHRKAGKILGCIYFNIHIYIHKIVTLERITKQAPQTQLNTKKLMEKAWPH